MPHTELNRLAVRALAALLLLFTGAERGASEYLQISFPDAQGYGKYSQGGRAGSIVYVDNLDDAGPGSLRACMQGAGARNCVFRVAGVIRLKTPIMVGEENRSLSVLGQTAPGGGILLTIDKPNRLKKHTPVIVKGSSDVIIRHMRFRPRLVVKNVDAITIERSRRVYVDHVSGSWATDENFNSHADTTELTVAYSLFGEGLEKHSKCALLGSDPTAAQKITFWRNACVSNRDRNPDNNHHGGSCIDIVNNLFFNARSEWAEIFSQYEGGTPISLVGNYFKAGPSTEVGTYAINWNDTQSATGPHIYQSDNQVWAPASKPIILIAPDTEQFLVGKPPCGLSVDKIVSSTQAYGDVRKYAGAFPRDAVDHRFIDEIGDIDVPGRGRMVRKPGELPAIEPAAAYLDEDRDGMPDSLEAAVGARIGVSDPWEDSDGDGWLNFDQVMQMLSDYRIAGKPVG